MMYILGIFCCKTPADFGQISAGAGSSRGLEFWPGTRSINGQSSSDRWTSSVPDSYPSRHVILVSIVLGIFGGLKSR